MSATHAVASTYNIGSCSYIPFCIGYTTHRVVRLHRQGKGDIRPWWVVFNFASSDGELETTDQGRKSECDLCSPHGGSGYRLTPAAGGAAPLTVTCSRRLREHEPANNTCPAPGACRAGEDQEMCSSTLSLTVIDW